MFSSHLDHILVAVFTNTESEDTIHISVFSGCLLDKLGIFDHSVCQKEDPLSAYGGWDFLCVLEWRQDVCATEVCCVRLDLGERFFHVLIIVGNGLCSLNSHPFVLAAETDDGEM